MPLRRGEKAKRIFGLMESHLAKNDWLALDRPTIADIACMPYVALSHEGGLSLEPYPAIRAWIGRIKALARLHHHAGPVTARCPPRQTLPLRLR